MELKKEDSTEQKLAFDKYNYWIMLSGLGVLMLGFIIMTMDKEPFGFGFLGLTLGPVLVFLGFIIEIFAILYRRK
ncbi:MAG: DUF3098 domain-containing protein [Bacteroidetes bacterium]|nr:MAG: DUF3098 domain-containing protein [Bacteroidota bacterium]TAG93889.1 MAG: DUF3098 domain-containing protein [Bacteroidota bacterium]